MKKIIGVIIISIFAVVGCSTIATVESIPQSLQLTGDDIEVGEVLTAELPYNSKDETLKEQLIAEALKDTNYDFIIMPRYEIVKTGFSTKMKIRGKGARVK
ncbi:hypothetical protein [Brachyspira hampsonii]|uniref:Lipoprotein n=2 Tax=Brachyspira hampsonii TaxID=1287055 RepID=A0A2U4EY45_9SPIR|nr:hypothetical protein [Brachyspira hampsonii]EKV58305.1 hypothetical protein A966_00935 [Brachyspira hampsonii 30446]MBW5389788.1 hypothetical protein [Brachyspira hampsonii]OEJ18765.1 hypothetical protein A9495_05350 [Brachyspira hampsonii]